MASIYQTTANVFTNIRALVSKDSNTISDATLLGYANKWYFWIMRELNQSTFISGEIATADLVANQQEYALPADETSSSYSGGIYQILRVEAALDGTNWHLLPEVDLLSYPQVFNDTNLTSRFTTSEPAFAWFDNSLWLWPIPAVAGEELLRIFWLKRPDEIAATSTISEVPKDFLGILETLVRSDVLTSLGRANESSLAKQEGFQMLERAKQLIEQADKSLVFRPQDSINDYK